MSDVSQGPGWWLASDGKWYPPHTAPQATVPPDASGAYPQYAAGTAAPDTTAYPQHAPGAGEHGAVADPYAQQAGAAPADPYAPQAGYPGPYQQPGAYPPGYGYAYGTAAPAPTDTGQVAVVTGVPVTTVPATTEPAAQSGRQPQPTATAPSRAGRAHWQPWLALAGVALVLWGLGQAALTWADWHVLQSQLAPFNTVTQGHIGMAASAAGAIVAGVATIAIALVLDRG